MELDTGQLYLACALLVNNSDITEMGDYKASKAYSYFKQGWVGKI